MTGDPATGTPYGRLLSHVRHRPSRVTGRTLEEEADADRGRVLFCAPFRRLQNKAQVFSLETNASVRSRLTHSLEVSSIGRFVAQQAIKAFDAEDLAALGIAGMERPLITFVETACLLHDLGNDVKDMKSALDLLRNPKMTRAKRVVDRLTPMQDFRSGVIRLLARHAGTQHFRHSRQRF